MTPRVAGEQSQASAAPPLVVLVDFDGTIARSDVSDEVVRRHASPHKWLPLEAAYLAGEIGSRTLLTHQAELLRDQADAIVAMGNEQPLDPDFVAFVAFLRGRSVGVEVVSDGLGFFVAPSLARIGLADLPVFTASMSFARGQATIHFPSGHPRCRVCGTCKRERVLVHQRAGRHVALVGDGFSDLYAAWYADTVFAKDHLADLCLDLGRAFHPWASFADVQAELAALIDNGVPPPSARPFVCGPEVWPAGTAVPRWDRPLAPRGGG
jgi:2-hydroxy-3-keto-5-methylthiopentenyl-1-phosphate phosphatase